MSQLAFNAAELKEALTGLKKALYERSVLPVLSCVHIQHKAGQTILSTSTQDVFLRYTCPTQQPEIPDVTWLTPLKPILDQVKLLKKTDTVWLRFHEKKLTLRVPVGEVYIDTTLENRDLKEWFKLPKIFGQPAELPASFGASILTALTLVEPQNQRPVLESVCLYQHDSHHGIVSTNGKILYVDQTHTLPWTYSLVLPAVPALKWMAGLKAPATLTAQPQPHTPPKLTGQKPEERWLMWVSGPWTCLLRLNTVEEYPQWYLAIPIQYSTQLDLDETAHRLLLEVIPKLDSTPAPGAVYWDLDPETGLSIQAFKRDKLDPSIPINGGKVTGEKVRVLCQRPYWLAALKLGLTQMRAGPEDHAPVSFCGPEKVVTRPCMVIKPMAVTKSK